MEYSVNQRVKVTFGLQKNQAGTVVKVGDRPDHEEAVLVHFDKPNGEGKKAWPDAWMDIYDLEPLSK